MKEILSSATTWMELERILLSEIRQMKKDKYHIIYLTWNIRKKKKNKNKLIDSENRLLVTRREGVEGG